MIHFLLFVFLNIANPRFSQSIQYDREEDVLNLIRRVIPLWVELGEYKVRNTYILLPLPLRFPSPSHVRVQLEVWVKYTNRKRSH